MQKISVLFTNNTLDTRAGSENYVRDVALALLRRGHHPVAFSLVLGPTADDLRRATVPVVDDLARLSARPDVIHGHHHLETLMAALRFPDVPVVHFCHGWIPWEEIPLKHPSIRKYVAVDEVCLDRLIREEGVPTDRAELLLNFVDLERFRPRNGLPAKPRRALVFSNSAGSSGYTEAIARACAASGVSLDIAGLLNGNPTESPEKVLAEYDLVFAKGRAALEALAVGCAVILSDTVGCGPLVVADNFDQLRLRNFGVRELQRPHDVVWYKQQIARYDLPTLARVHRRVRAEASLDTAVDRLLTIYTETMAVPVERCDPSQVAGDYLRRIAPTLKRAGGLTTHCYRLVQDLETARAEVGTLRGQLQQKDEALAETSHRLRAASDRERFLEAQVTAFQALPTLRVRDGILRIPLVGRALRAGCRYLAGWIEPGVASRPL